MQFSSTHEHQDHVEPEQVKEILAKNPGARVITHEGAGRVLTEAGIPWEKIVEGDEVSIKGVTIKSVGHEHATIYKNIAMPDTGFLIGDLFVPGDAVHDVPDAPVRVLALPTAGPWMKISEAIDYAKKIKPQVVFPIHDALYIEQVQRSFAPRFIGSALEGDGIVFKDLAAGATIEV
jgi:L-ascorbate metabolism protein UlaG (beta-lactamase superfamily)